MGSWRKDDTRCKTMDIDKRESVKGKKKRNWTIKCCTAWRWLSLSDVALERARDGMGEVRRPHIL